MSGDTSPTADALLASLHPLERAVLLAFKDAAQHWEADLPAHTGLDESRVSMALGWLQTKGAIAADFDEPVALVSITDLGKKYLEIGFPEQRILTELQAGRPVTIGALRQRPDLDASEVSTATGNLKAYDLIRIGDGGTLSATDKRAPAELDGVMRLLQTLQGGPAVISGLSHDGQTLLAEFIDKRWKTRGIVKRHERRRRRFALSPLGAELARRVATEGAVEELARLTPELLKTGGWRGQRFRRYNINLRPARGAIGRKHPYREFLDDVKTRLIAMGFSEMRGPLVESEFWNSDALFMPQFHPARDIHDVYFVKQPRRLESLPEPFARQVGDAHERGWKTGSRGWRYAFDPERAKRLVLRSQGTALSARTLASGPKVPGRYFGIARCFRYDLVDATHAPDFFQVEGIALGPEINFRRLLGLLQLFATEMARAAEVKFLPAYFPYTEPSVEMHARHPKLGWMELGGAGLLRPEVTLPLGVDAPVIAWGLGLDRMAMVALGIHDIRDLFSADLDLIRQKRGASV